MCLDSEGQNETKVRQWKQKWLIGLWPRTFLWQFSVNKPIMEHDCLSTVIDRNYVRTDTNMSSKFPRVYKYRSLTMKRDMQCRWGMAKDSQALSLIGCLIAQNNSVCVLNLVPQSHVSKGQGPDTRVATYMMRFSSMRGNQQFSWVGNRTVQYTL